MIGRLLVCFIALSMFSIKSWSQIYGGQGYEFDPDRFGALQFYLAMTVGEETPDLTNFRVVNYIPHSDTERPYTEVHFDHSGFSYWCRAKDYTAINNGDKIIVSKFGGSFSCSIFVVKNPTVSSATNHEPVVPVEGSAGNVDFDPNGRAPGQWKVDFVAGIKYDNFELIRMTDHRRHNPIGILGSARIFVEFKYDNVGYGCYLTGALPQIQVGDFISLFDDGVSTNGSPLCIMNHWRREIVESPNSISPFVALVNATVWESTVTYVPGMFVKYTAGSGTEEYFLATGKSQGVVPSSGAAGWANVDYSPAP